jgi:hypothetical protein
MIHVPCPEKNFVSPIINAYRNYFAKLLNVGQQIIPVMRYLKLALSSNPV